MIQLKTNQYWGKRSGSVHKDGSNCFKIKKWANGSNNAGPTGWKLKKRTK